MWHESEAEATIFWLLDFYETAKLHAAVEALPRRSQTCSSRRAACSTKCTNTRQVGICRIRRIKCRNFLTRRIPFDAAASQLRKRVPESSRGRESVGFLRESAFGSECFTRSCMPGASSFQLSPLKSQRLMRSSLSREFSTCLEKNVRVQVQLVCLPPASQRRCIRQRS